MNGVVWTSRQEPETGRTQVWSPPALTRRAWEKDRLDGTAWTNDPRTQIPRCRRKPVSQAQYTVKCCDRMCVRHFPASPGGRSLGFSLHVTPEFCPGQMAGVGGSEVIFQGPPQGHFPPQHPVLPAFCSAPAGTSRRPWVPRAGHPPASRPEPGPLRPTAPAQMATVATQSLNGVSELGKQRLHE